MKKLVKILVVVVVVLIVLLAAGVFALNRYVQRPEFKDYVLGKTQEQLAVPLQVESLRVALFSGFELRGLVVKNPTGSQTEALLKGDEVVFRYRLWPLLRKRIEIEKISVQSPTITLEKYEDGAWNYEKLTKEEAGKPKPAAAKPQPTGLDFEIANLSLANANLLFLKPGNQKLLVVTDLDVRSAASGSGQALAARGDLSVREASVIDSIIARDIRSPLVVEQQQLKLTDISGKIEDGTLKGTVTVDLDKDGYPYTVHADVADVTLDKLASRFSDKAKYLTGKFRATADLTGVGGDTDKLKGKGAAHVDQGTMTGIPLLQTVGALLRIAELERIQFDEITLEFTMDNGVIEAPVIKLLSKDIQITGSGRTDFDFHLNHQLTLALSPAITDKMPKEVANVLAKRDDGFRALAFHVSGPYDSPKTNIAEQLAKGAAGSLIEKGLQQFLGGEKKKSSK